jgi:hypothetical protein
MFDKNYLHIQESHTNACKTCYRIKTLFHVQYWPDYREIFNIRQFPLPGILGGGG